MVGCCAGQTAEAVVYDESGEMPKLCLHGLRKMRRYRVAFKACSCRRGVVADTSGRDGLAPECLRPWIGRPALCRYA